jgi:hypothetical protein
MHSATICYAEPSLTKSDCPISETRGSRISRNLDDSNEMIMIDPDDWMTPLIHYLDNTGHIANRKVQRQALKYVMLDNTLYCWTIEGLLLNCLVSNQSKIAMWYVHEGICGTHQSAHKIKWLLHRAGFYWLTMLNYYFMYYKSCESCQKFRDMQLTPTSMLHPIIKPIPFHGWTLDFIGQIYPSSSKGYRIVLVATDYFTKWKEAVSLMNMTHKEVIHFISEHVVQKFNIPQTLITD